MTTNITPKDGKTDTTSAVVSLADRMRQPPLTVPHKTAPKPRLRSEPEDVLATVHKAADVTLDQVERQAFHAELESRTLDVLRLRCLSRIEDTKPKDVALLEVERAIERGRYRANRQAIDERKEEIKR